MVAVLISMSTAAAPSAESISTVAESSTHKIRSHSKYWLREKYSTEELFIQESAAGLPLRFVLCAPFAVHEAFRGCAQGVLALTGRAPKRDPAKSIVMFRARLALALSS